MICVAWVRGAENKPKVAAVGDRFVYEVQCLDINLMYRLADLVLGSTHFTSSLYLHVKLRS
jgi:hypothetical protein